MTGELPGPENPITGRTPGGAPDAPTPGQAAYEAYVAAAHLIRETQPWEDLAPDFQAAMEAAARAGADRLFGATVDLVILQPGDTLAVGVREPLPDDVLGSLRERLAGDVVVVDNVTGLATDSAARLAAVTAERDQLRRERDEAEDENRKLLDAWPKCPDGCGCRIGTEDADRLDCGCGGPCCTACRENGYPDEPSYRDAATADLRDLAAEILAAFDASKGDGYRARVGQVQIAKWRERAGLEES